MESGTFTQKLEEMGFESRVPFLTYYNRNLTEKGGYGIRVCWVKSFDRSTKVEDERPLSNLGVEISVGNLHTPTPETRVVNFGKKENALAYLVELSNQETAQMKRLGK